MKSIYHQLELQLKGKIDTSGQTGAVITDICNDTESAIKLVQEWIQSACYKKEDISIGLHCYGSYSCDENFNYTVGSKVFCLCVCVCVCVFAQNKPFLFLFLGMFCFECI